MTCTRCGRRLKNPSATGLGPVCRLAVLGPAPKAAKAAQRRSVARDEATPDLFAEVRCG
jgi:hypothetical protein